MDSKRTPEETRRLEGQQKKVAELVELGRREPGGERTIGNNLGFALGQGGGRDVAEAYSKAVGTPLGRTPEDHVHAGFTQGYLAAVRDIALAFVRGADEQHATDPSIAADWVSARVRALEVLRLARAREVIRVSDVATEFGEPWERSFRLLREMGDLRLLREVPNPDPDTWLYGLTLLGERVLERIEMTMGEPAEFKSVRDERAVVAQAIRNQANARTVLLMISTPEMGTVPTALERDEAHALSEWLGSWLRRAD